MKKNLLFAALVAAMGGLTSCSDDVTLSSEDPLMGNAIIFSTGKVNLPATRSAVTINSLNKFTVSCVNPDSTTFFADEVFTYGSSYFTSSIPHYWPTTGTLSFYAISDTGDKSLDDANVPHYTYTDWAAEKDLVAATVIAGTKQMPYPLSFKHVTSQIMVGAEAEDKTEELTYKLVSVQLTAPSTGTYSFDAVSGGTGSWSINKEKTSVYSYNDTLPLSFAQNSSVNLSTRYWNILPTAQGMLNFRVEYQVLQNGRVISDFTGENYKEAVITNPDLEAGKRYTYKFILTRSTDDVITFTASVANWDTAEASSEVLYDPALTYVTYTDGTTKTFNVSGSIKGGSYGYPGTALFGDYTTIKNIRLGNTVTSLQAYAFSKFNALESIYIPSSVTSIGEGAFYCCSSLKALDLPTAIKDLPRSLCESCKSMEKITFSDKLTSIGIGVFNNCWALKEFNLPNTVTTIGNGALSYCYSLETVTLSKNLASMDDNVFVGDSCLRSIIVPEGNTHFSDVDGVLYDYDKTTLLHLPQQKTGSLSLPSTLKNIKDYAGENTKITSLTIPDGVNIGNMAFSNANLIESINFGANCTLGTNAFRQNYMKTTGTHLKSVTFNGKVTLAGYAVFWGCTNLATITYNSLEAPEFDTSVITSTYNGWSSTSATNAVGYNTRSEGTNMFYVPKDATYSESDLDQTKAVIFDTNYGGFTLSKTL